MSLPTENETVFLREAAVFLENQSIVMKIANLLGKPLDFLQKSLPESAQAVVSKSVDKSMKSLIKISVSTMNSHVEKKSFTLSNVSSGKTKWGHTALATVSGGVGGFFGLPALPVELPISLGLIFRSIATIAQDFGEDPSDPAVQMDCMFVFTLGSQSEDNSEMDSSYLSSRIALSRTVSQAAEYLAMHSAKEVLLGIERGSAPAIVNFMARIAASLEISISGKIVAEAIPIVGAAGGATVNACFADYFSQAARYHFGIKNLEKKYSKKIVQDAYKTFSKNVT